MRIWFQTVVWAKSKPNIAFQMHLQCIRFSTTLTTYSWKKFNARLETVVVSVSMLFICLCERCDTEKLVSYRTNTTLSHIYFVAYFSLFILPFYTVPEIVSSRKKNNNYKSVSSTKKKCREIRHVSIVSCMCFYLYLWVERQWEIYYWISHSHTQTYTSDEFYCRGNENKHLFRVSLI